MPSSGQVLESNPHHKTLRADDLDKALDIYNIMIPNESLINTNIKKKEKIPQTGNIIR